MKAHPNLYILIDGRKICAAIEAIMSHIRKKETSSFFHHKLFPFHLSHRIFYRPQNQPFRPVTFKLPNLFLNFPAPEELLLTCPSQSA